MTPATNVPEKSGAASGLSAGSSAKITTLCWIPGSSLRKSSSIGSSEATDRLAGSKPETAAPFGAASVTTCASGPASSPVPIATIAMPPQSIATPATTPIIEKSAPLDRRLRDATIVASPRIVIATISAITVAAEADTDSRTREKPNSTSPMMANVPIGITIGKNNPCRVSWCGSGAGAALFSSVS